MVRYDIVLATYNGEKYLVEQLDSILRAVEYCKIGEVNSLIVSDDYSTDMTREIVSQYILDYPFVSLVLNSGEKGVKGNFQNGLDNVSSDYVFLCDQDDVWFEYKVEESLKAILRIEENEKVPSLILSNLKFVDEYQNDLTLKHDFSALDTSDVLLTAYRSFGQGCTMLMNKSLMEMALPIPNLAVMHDWWLLLVASNFGKVEYIATPLMNYRQHANNVCGGYSRYSFYRFFDFSNQKKYIQAVSIQSSVFLNRYEIKSLKSYKAHYFLANLKDTSIVDKYVFFRLLFSRLGSGKNRVKLLVQLFLG